MKTLFALIGIFAFGLFIENGLAKSKPDNGRIQRQAYLPPVSKNTIREEFVTIKEEEASNHGQFDESSYGGGNFEVYEVHNHYKPSQYNGGNAGSIASSYIPPEQQIRVQHIYHSSGGSTSQSGSSGFHSSQGNSQSQDEEIVRVQHVHVNRPSNGNGPQSSAKYLPPLRGTQQSQRPSTDYLAPPQTSSQQVHSAIKQGSQFRGPQYLPPHGDSPQGHAEPPASNYIAPLQQAPQPIHNQSPQTGVFKGPHYLPPKPAGDVHSIQQNEVQQQVQGIAPNYSPPKQPASEPVNIQVQQGGLLKGPDYLPPHPNGGAQHGQYNQVPHTVQQPSNDYLAPHQPSQQPIHNHPAQAENFKAPDYLPPHSVGNAQPVQHHGIQQQIQQPSPEYLAPPQPAPEPIHNGAQQGGDFKGPDYLPPHADYSTTQQAGHQQVHNHNQIQQVGQFRAPDYLPPKHSQQSQTQAFQASGYLPPQQQTAPAQNGVYKPEIQNILPPPQQQYQQPLQQPIKEIQQELPSGYDFVKPGNAEEAIAELHTLPREDEQQIQVQSQAQVVSAQHQSNNVQGNAYLPPQIGPQQINTNYQAHPNNVQTLESQFNQVSPQTFPPAPESEAAQAPSKNYLPPAAPVQSLQHSSHLQSNVQSNLSYEPPQSSAPRQPFPAYGPPPHNTALIATQQKPQEQLVALPITTVHQQQAAVAPNYASAVSYSSHQQNHYQYPQPIANTVQAPLQVALPRPTIVSPPPSAPISQPISSRVRTIQIVNPSGVKNLQILETSDHDGVKTIKILGSSSHQPTGDHRVVKVLTQNANNQHEQVQTVKIFNDLNDAPIGGSNTYLPPPPLKQAGRPR